MKRSIDLNCDLGESYGIYTLGHDTEIMPYVTSVNIACGFHAGDAMTMQKTVRAALQAGVAIGAHPGFQDLQGFGRRDMQLSADEVYTITLYQIGALAAFVKAEGGILHHVKPHGALYNMAAKNETYAKSIAQAVKDVDERLILYGLSGSYLTQFGKEAGLQVAHEAFMDRTYTSNGTLTPRNEANALIHSGKEALEQAIMMITEQKVLATTGEVVPLQADTLCLHGDGEGAVNFAKLIRKELQKYAIEAHAIE